MAIKNANDLDFAVQHAGTWGNVSVARGTISLSAATNGDTFRFLKLPAYAELLDATLIVTDAADALTTMSLGYEHADGSTGDDAAHFLSATAISATGLNRADQAKAPVELTKDSYISGTLGGANITALATFEVVVTYRYNGK